VAFGALAIFVAIAPALNLGRLWGRCGELFGGSTRSAAPRGFHRLGGAARAGAEETEFDPDEFSPWERPRAPRGASAEIMSVGSEELDTHA
jgi:hypothetical protein